MEAKLNDGATALMLAAHGGHAAAIAALLAAWAEVDAKDIDGTTALMLAAQGGHAAAIAALVAAGAEAKPQSSQASYLQKAARRANWTPSNSIQPLTPQAGVVLTGTASEGEAPPPYRSAPDFPPAAPPFTFLPAPDVPLPPKKSVSFSGGPSVHE